MNSDLNKKVVSDEIALKLKELNYDYECIFGRCERNDKLKHKLSINNHGDCSISWDKFEYDLPLPLWQDVIDWFRDKYRYDIQIIYRHSDTDKVEGINSVYYDINIYHLSGGDAWKIYKFNQYSDDYYKTREKAILILIDLINEKK